MTISVINATMLHRQEVQDKIRAVNRQLQEDFKRYWQDATASQVHRLPELRKALEHGRTRCRLRPAAGMPTIATLHAYSSALPALGRY